MIIDCHYHLDERVYPIDRLISEMQKSGIDKIAFMGSIIGPFEEPPRFLVRVLQTLLEHSLSRGLEGLSLKMFNSFLFPQFLLRT
jgi:hypothetical protein